MFLDIYSLWWGLTIKVGFVEKVAAMAKVRSELNEAKLKA